MKGRRLATAAVLLALIVAAFEGTVVTTAMPTIAADLGGMSLYAWVFSAFLVASAVGVLVCGKLADGYGRLPVFTIGTLLFLTGSILCGSARGIGALIVFRAIQGLGAGAIQPIAMTITTDLYTLEERARIQGLLTAAWGAANVSGPILGGLIVAKLSWRWVFYVNVPFALGAVALLLASFRDRAREAKGAPGWPGALFAGLTTAAALLSLEPRAPLRAWFGVLAILGGGGLVLQQSRSASPLLPNGIYKSRTVRAGLVGSAFGGGILYACAAYVPLWIARRSGGASAAYAGIPLIFLLGGWAFGSTFGVRVLVMKGMRASAAGGYAIGVAGAAALAFVVLRGAPVIFAYAALVVLGVGLGPAASTSLVAPQNHVAPDLRGAMTSSIYATRTLGGAIVIALLGAITRAFGDSSVFVSIAALTATAALLLAALAPATPGVPAADAAL